MDLAVAVTKTESNKQTTNSIYKYDKYEFICGDPTLAVNTNLDDCPKFDKLNKSPENNVFFAIRNIKL